MDYLSGVRGELTHVKWPSSAQAVGYTALVIVISVLVGVLVAAFDTLFTFLIEQAVIRF